MHQLLTAVVDKFLLVQLSCCRLHKMSLTAICMKLLLCSTMIIQYKSNAYVQDPKHKQPLRHVQILSQVSGLGSKQAAWCTPSVQNWVEAESCHSHSHHEGFQTNTEHTARLAPFHHHDQLLTSLCHCNPKHNKTLAIKLCFCLPRFMAWTFSSATKWFQPDATPTNDSYRFHVELKSGQSLDWESTALTTKLQWHTFTVMPRT